MRFNLNTYFFSVYERFFLYKWLVLLSNASVISLHKREAIWLLFFYVSFGMRLPLPLRIVLPYRKSFYCFGRGCRCDVCDIIPLSSIPTGFYGWETRKISILNNYLFRIVVSREFGGGGSTGPLELPLLTGMLEAGNLAVWPNKVIGHPTAQIRNSNNTLKIQAEHCSHCSKDQLS